MAGAIGAAFTAASGKTTNPSLILLFTMVGVGLAFYAQSPRSNDARERATDIEHDKLSDDGNPHH